jgi:tetratricopeptide (TPR) repeat protein
LVTAEKLLTEGLTLAQAQAEKDLESSFFSYLSIISFKATRLSQALEQVQMALTLRKELELHLRIVDDLATLAAIHLRAGHPALALDYTHQALAILEQCKAEGPEFPQRDYFICYQVLAAAGQIELAYAALQAAYRLVIARAEKIVDPALRKSFLEQVAINREIVVEWEKQVEI